MKKPLILIILSCIFVSVAKADIIYLKNGRSIEGLIKVEDENGVELEVGFGTVRFDRVQIERIEKSGLQEAVAIKRKWERQKVENEKRILERQLEEEKQPKKIEFSHDQAGMVVGVLINKKIEASLVLDTGASVVMLTKGMGEKLGINLEDDKNLAQVQLADGRKAEAKRIILESVKVENIEAENVEAIILLNDIGEASFKDGLLGMSFLSKFNFKIDHSKKQLILEKF